MQPQPPKSRPGSTPGAAPPPSPPHTLYLCRQLRALCLCHEQACLPLLHLGMQLLGLRTSRRCLPGKLAVSRKLVGSYVTGSWQLLILATLALHLQV